MEGNLGINNDNVVIAKIEPVVPTIHFIGKDSLEIMRLDPNGDIYVHGLIIENDKEVVEGLRKFLSSHGY